MYDSETNLVTSALQDASPTVFTDATINQILALTTKTGDTTVRFDTVTPDGDGNVTVAAGAEVVFVASSNTQQTTVKPPANAPVVIFQGKGGVVATINDATATIPSGDQSRVDRVVVGSAGDDKIIIADARNTKIILGTGNSIVETGKGVDTVEAGLGNSTIVGGSGDYAVVKLAGAPTNYTVTVNNGHAIVTNNTNTKVTDVSKIQYVQLDGGNALIFANNSVEAAVSTLYQTAFGRTAEAGGLDYWFDLVRGGATMNQISNAFTNSAEFAAQATKSNNDFVNSLYQNTFGRAGEDAGVAYWLDALGSGATRADLINSFAQIGANNIAGTIQTEVELVGSVTIVTGII